MTDRWKTAICCATLGLVVTAACHAQEAVHIPKSPDVHNGDEHTTDSHPKPQPAIFGTTPFAPPSGIPRTQGAAITPPKDPLPEEAELYAERIKFERDMLAHSRAVFADQQSASKLVFWVVHGMVIAAFILAVAEFGQAAMLRSRGKLLADTELTLKMESIAVKTTSVGLIMLAVAAAFYFMYLKFVYTIQVV